MAGELNPDGFIAKMRARNERLAVGGVPPTPSTNGAHVTNGDHTAYTQAAANAELTDLANTTTGARNHILNVVALKLGRLPIDRVTLRQELINACRTNRLITDDGLKTVEATIDSAFDKADRDGPRIIPQKNVQNWTSSNYNAETPPGATPSQPLEQLEQDFWEARNSLKIIHQAALSRMTSPWAVFACCAARILTLIPPAITLPAVIGGPGSLNWYAAITAKSGGGKGAAMAVAHTLVPADIIIRGIGSGEGMIEAYQRAEKEEPSPITAILFSIDEIDSLGAMGGRTGQTTMSILRQGFSGEALGYSYRGRQSETVAAHTYRMTLLASVQPERAGTLFDQTAGGTPQRFMWFPGRDKRITAHPPEWPSGRNGRPHIIPVISQVDLRRAPNIITIPDQVADFIRQTRAASMNGGDVALDGHALFCREKLAYALAYMHGNLEITEDDWRLSGIAAAVSDWCRTKVATAYQEGKDRLSRERGQCQALANDERSLVEQEVYFGHLARIERSVVKNLKANGPMTPAALRHALTSRDRSRFDVAIAEASNRGVVVLVDGRWQLG